MFLGTAVTLVNTSYDRQLTHSKSVTLNTLCCFAHQDKVMLGTDYPFPLGELEPGSLIESMDELDNTLKVTDLT